MDPLWRWSRLEDSDQREHREVAVAGSDEGQHEATVNLGAGSGEQDVGSGAACLGRNCTLPRCAADSGTLP